MATFKKHLLDMRWLLKERGLQHVYDWLTQFADATTQGTTPIGAGAIGNLDCDAANANGFTAALTNTINPSGQLASASTTLEYSSGATAVNPPWQTR